METPSNFDGEIKKTEISLVEKIGFIETEEMKETKRKILLVGIESEEFGGLYSHYQEEGESLADSIPGAEGRIALMISLAQIIEELGLLDDAIEAYTDAYYSAQQEDLDDVKVQIAEILDRLENKGK